MLGRGKRVRDHVIHVPTLLPFTRRYAWLGYTHFLLSHHHLSIRDLHLLQCYPTSFMQYNDVYSFYHDIAESHVKIALILPSLFLLCLIRPPSVHNEIKDVSCASLPSFPLTPPPTTPFSQCTVLTYHSLHAFLDLETTRIQLKETSSSGDIISLYVYMIVAMDEIVSGCIK